MSAHSVGMEVLTLVAELTVSFLFRGPFPMRADSANRLSTQPRGVYPKLGYQGPTRNNPSCLEGRSPSPEI